MADRSGIEWTDATWNPIRGCSRVSAGCQHCYAELVAARFSGPGQPYEGLARRRSNGEPQWTGKIAFVEKHLKDPLRWQRPRRIFVNSMSDLFHENAADGWIANIFAVMALARRHQFQVLTKRPARMLQLLSSVEFRELVGAFVTETAFELTDPHNRRTDDLRATAPDVDGDDWPLPNVWLGTSVENQDVLYDRIGALLKTPAAVRFLSCEPLLGPLTLSPFLTGLTHRGEPTEIHWVIVGGESGPHARPMDVQWARSIVEQCQGAGVPVFVKQLGAEPGFRLEDEERRGNTMPGFHHFDATAQLHIKRLSDRKGGDMTEWPEELRVREFPQEVAHA